MADTATAAKWHYKASYLEFCNCAYGCPCNFNGFPTHGNCRAVLGLRITEGSLGDVDLAGATVAGAASWPKAIHDGDGTMAVFFDPSTTEEQMTARQFPCVGNPLKLQGHPYAQLQYSRYVPL